MNGITTTHRWDGSNIVGESTGSTNYTYYRGLNLIAQSDGTVTGYYHYNGHGDAVKITDSITNSVLASYDYDAFGNQKDVTENIHNPFRYNGQYTDEETGLIYLHNRYYEPSSGRFITEDPAKDGMNWYVYCSGDPVNRWDPSGCLDWGYDSNGVWHDWDRERFGGNSGKYSLLEGLTNAYYNAYSDEDRARISYLADTLRVTDTTITAAVLLNNSKGANGFGHNGVLLLNSAGQGFFFSYYPVAEGGALYDEGEMRFSILTVDEVNELKDRSGAVNEAVTINGDRRWEDGDYAYDRFVWCDVAPQDGEAMLRKASQVFKFPGEYQITGYQCDNVANEILSAGNHGYHIWAAPSNSYDTYKSNKTHWLNQNGRNRGAKL